MTCYGEVERLRCSYHFVCGSYSHYSHAERSLCVPFFIQSVTKITTALDWLPHSYCNQHSVIK